jgi:hypothetical protein
MSGEHGEGLKLKVSPEDLIIGGCCKYFCVKGTSKDQGYAKNKGHRQNFGGYYLLHQRVARSMGLRVPKLRSGVTINHINQDKLDNRRINIRCCSKSVYAANVGLRPGNKSGHPNVYFVAARGSWSVDYPASISGGKRRHGSSAFKTKEAAIAHLDEVTAQFEAGAPLPPKRPGGRPKKIVQ